jgi:hypothetical protein
MSKYERCPREIEILAIEIINLQPHQELLRSAEPKIDFLFAYGPRNEHTGVVMGPALTHHGVPAQALCRINNLKKRVLGLGDAEISIDADNWKEFDEEEQRALLDHELYHLEPTGDTDGIGRPKLRIRKHDFDVGWFAVIARAHGKASAERRQAKSILDAAGQFFWPDLIPISPLADVTIATKGKKRRWTTKGVAA